ncbi:hypothetical protein Tsubulata_006461 [Turnera subulata]|uniref:RRM domain-containing protein n=1 Tax=Turnera subulata TaxID=218843 RepID=A0A9Q0FBQ9_9ROSI|nr:hypothetical protein Tsubulata_006461 [Turnera subulata]
MPSEIMDLKRGLSSSSFFSEDASFPGERQVGFWKADSIPDQHAVGRSIGLSSMENHLAKSLEHPQSLLIRGQKLNHSLDRHVVGAERALSQSLNVVRPMDHDLGSRMSLNGQPTSYFADSSKVNGMTTQYENSLFSSSLSELFSQKLRLSANNALYGHSIDAAASHFEEEEPLESLEELEAQTIGNLLPNDDDLFTGVTDKMDSINQTSGGDDMEDLDLFSSVGGMDLGEDGSGSQIDSEFPNGISNIQLGLANGEHPNGEHPSRTLFVRNINSNVEDSELKALFEQYGDIRTLYTSCKQRGFVMISYYDIRAARNAMKALQNRPLRRRKLDIHYSIPKDNPSEKDVNQGTLVVFNLDSSVSNDELRQIFGIYGEVKEIRETPHRNHQKFVEFYDIRAAEAALRALNKSDIAGKQIKVEPSRPGGSRRSLLQQIAPEMERDEVGSYMQQSSPPNNSTTGFSGPPPLGAIIPSSIENGTISGLPSALKAPFLESRFHHGISSSVPNGLSSLLRVESTGKQAGVNEPSHLQSPLKIDMQATPNLHPQSLPEYHDGLNFGIHSNPLGTRATNINLRPPERIDNRQLSRNPTNGHPVEFNDGVFGSASHGSCSLPGHHYTWGNSYHRQPPGMMWPSSQSQSLVNGMSVGPLSTRLHGHSRGMSPMMNPVLPINNQHVGSAPAVNPSLWDKRHAYAAESPETSGFHPGSLGSMRIPNNALQSMEFVSPNVFPHVGGNCMELPVAPKSTGLQSHHQRSMMFPGRGGQMIPMINAFDAPNERTRSRRNEGSMNQADKKQYELDIDRILRGEDSRTTLMIKNIPNKYTSKMLLAAIDERHKGTYDFIYLPIDFKAMTILMLMQNKCNVGYAFINMIDASQIIPFYQAFNGKKWEKFNSEKVASLAYARIQGKAALIAHFQNSSLMNEDKRCRPILFNTDGPNAGDQVPFPMGVNVRTRPGKLRTINHEENQLGSPSGEDSLSGDNSSGSGKESD